MIRAWIGVVAALILCGSIASAQPVVSGTIEGVINPMTARYLDRLLEHGRHQNAACVLVHLDTPGGLDDAMRHMVQAILNSQVPVVVYVAPSGARAASAGVFITLAAHIAAMAPGTNIGAAHPVALGEGKMDSVMADKVTNDATATIRAIAQVRQRNVRWAEDAVRRSLSLTDREALDSGVVDLVAPTETDLLRELDGRTMRVGTEQRTLHLDSPRIERVEMNWLEKFFHIITDPNIALLLLSLGFFAIVIEFYTPGTFGPAIAGAILLILGFMATGSLPLNWAGVLLLLLAAILLVVELYTPTVGVFAIGSALAFVLGALILFTPTAPTSPSLPQVSVNSGLIAALAALVLIIGILLARVAVRTQRSRPHSGVELLLGQSGIAKTDLSPIGTVLVNSEEWSAENVGADIVARGDHVEVVGIRGTVLQVHKSSAISPPADG